MKKSDIDNLLIDALKQPLAELGFEFDKASHRFWRTNGDIRQMVDWYLYTAGGGQAAVPGCGVVSDAVIDLYAQVIPVNPADRKSQLTIGAALWRIAGRKRTDGEFMITTPSEGQQAAAAMLQMMRSEAGPFLETCTSLDGVDRILNADPDSPRAMIFSTLMWPRLAKSLIVAHLVGNPRYGELAAHFDGKLREFEPNAVPALAKLRALLEARPPHRP
jgi:hypothetical protein